MYLIIPQYPDNTDWSLTPQAYALALDHDKHDVLPLTMNDNPETWAGAVGGRDITLVVSRAGFGENLCAPVLRRVIEAKANDWHCVYVHFGSINRVDFDRARITEEWARVCQDLALTGFRQDQLVIPISNRGGLGWTEHISRCQAALRVQNVGQCLASLDEARKLAKQDLNLEVQPDGVVVGEKATAKDIVDALLPFYVDVSALLPVLDAKDSALQEVVNDDLRSAFISACTRAAHFLKDKELDADAAFIKALGLPPNLPAVPNPGALKSFIESFGEYQQRWTQELRQAKLIVEKS